MMDEQLETFSEPHSIVRELVCLLDLSIGWHNNPVTTYVFTTMVTPLLLEKGVLLLVCASVVSTYCKCCGVQVPSRYIFTANQVMLLVHLCNSVIIVYPAVFIYFVVTP
ncbi:hypothetical protein TNCT_178131 [Trichonephila clavata]|uniref:Uncharacterized protein n=1 Tax=Trichonephila clavata TaxID=2740835 RepID=A0A8X6IIG0_TRICU|nr:hypothetical protein TNCT_178131 [Trichonephila clavata]